MPRKSAARREGPAADAVEPKPRLYSRPLSHSSISMYLECPQKFKLKYLDKLPETPKWFFSFGQSVHSALEFFYSIPALPPPSVDQILLHYRQNWKKEGYKDAEQERDYLAQGEKILREFYKKHIAGFRLPLFAEYKFELQVEGVPLLGFVDRIDKLDNGNLAIVDYKTGKAIESARLAEDRQLTMYQLAVESLLGAKVESLTFYHLPTQRPLTVGPRPPEQVDRLKATIVEVNAAIQDGRFDPTPEERKCQWCDFKPHCPAFRPGFYGPKPEAPAAARPAAPHPKESPLGQPDLIGGPSDSSRLAELVDRYGDLLARQQELEAESARLRAQIAALLAKNGYVRAFGSRFEVSASPEVKWDFRDRGKVLDVLKRHGLYDRVLKPSAPEVYRLLGSGELPAEARRDLESLGERKEQPALVLKPLS